MNSINIIIKGANNMVWIKATMLNGWKHYSQDTGDASYSDIEYCIDSDGFVHFRGLANGSGGVVAPWASTNDSQYAIFTLPVGFRPSKRILQRVPDTDKLSRLDVTPDGSVVMIGSDTVRGYVSFDGYTFKAN